MRPLIYSLSAYSAAVGSDSLAPVSVDWFIAPHRAQAAGEAERHPPPRRKYLDRHDAYLGRVALDIGLDRAVQPHAALGEPTTASCEFRTTLPTLLAGLRFHTMAVLFQDGQQPSTTPIGLYESSMPGSTGKRFFVE